MNISGINLSTYYEMNISGFNLSTYCEMNISGFNLSTCYEMNISGINLSTYDRLVGLVVKASASRAGDPGFESRWGGIFSGSSHTSDLKTGTPVATLPGAWRYRVSTGTGRPGVSILWLGEVERWICNIYLSVAARKIVWADPSLRYTSLLLGR